MSAFYDLNKTPRNILNQAIVRAIVSENNGAWFDPSDLSTLFQDAAGTTPVTAVEQPVGKILDKSGNGNHATQSITASRPTLSARYNLLTKTEDFADAAWLKEAGTIVNSAVSNPINAAQVSKFIPDTTMGIHRVSQQWGPILGVKYTQQVLLKSAGVRYVYINVDTNLGAKLCVDLQTGQFMIGGLSPELASVVSVGDGWYLCTITGTGTSQTGDNTWFQANGFFDATDDFTFTGSGSNGFLIAAADLRLGTTSGPYQRVNTATDYDTDERYFPKYLQFDGIDDYLTLGDVFDIGIEGVSIAASVILFDATKSSIAGKSRAAAEGGRYFLGVEPSSFLFASHDIASPVNIGLAAPIAVNTVFTAKLGPHGARYLSLYKNAALINSIGTPLTTSSYDTNNPFWIGAYPNSSGTTPAYGYLNGGIYGLIITKSALTDAQRIACERYLGRKSGVQL